MSDLYSFFILITTTSCGSDHNVRVDSHITNVTIIVDVLYETYLAVDVHINDIHYTTFGQCNGDTIMANGFHVAYDISYYCRQSKR